MKILSVKQIQALDAYTIANEPIASLDLMERASQAFVEAFVKLYSADYEVNIFCGLGNNGGDGLAIARLLLEKNYSIRVFVVRYAEKTSEDFEKNYQRLLAIHPIINLRESSDFPPFAKEKSLIIDAVFGSGLSRALSGLSADIILKINQLELPKVAVDIASGLVADGVSTSKAILKPTHTISFQLPKLAFLLPENAEYVGNWQVVPIGLSEKFIHDASSLYFYLDAKEAIKYVKKRAKFSHKGTYGHALLMVGSLGKVGAAVLCARACLRAGVGLLTVHIPKCAYTTLQTTVPEAMALVDEGQDFLQSFDSQELANYSAIGIGCGLDTQTITLKAFRKFLEKRPQNLVLDADALNLIAQNPDLKELIPKNSILTPHPKEFERLTRKTENHFERLEVLKNFAQTYGVYVVLKGAHSAIAIPEGKVFFNSTGNPGMATGGSGDVLTGIISGLLAQKYNPLEASLLGVYLHGLAGDLALQTQSVESLIASDLIENMGNAFKNLASFSKK
jgi:NAD(P)H-hydrate epimerase